MKWIYGFIIALLPCLTMAQENLKVGVEQYYQNWLDETGMGEVLQVRLLLSDATKKSHTLYLEFPTENLDTIAASWHSLKDAYEASHPLTLEQSLFFKFAYFMDVSQEQLHLEIYDCYDVDRCIDALFHVQLSFDAGVLQIDANTKQRSEDRKIYLNLPPLNIANAAQGSLNLPTHRANVFDKIKSYAKQHYTRTTCEGRQPSYELLSDKSILRFEITDLCKEVLEDEGQPFPCKVLRQMGQNCNWIKREKLYFTIVYSALNDGHALLEVNIDGKYASGYYDAPKNGGYIPMESGFRDYLSKYADAVALRFEQLLSRP